MAFMYGEFLLVKHHVFRKYFKT